MQINKKTTSVKYHEKTCLDLRYLMFELSRDESCGMCKVHFRKKYSNVCFYGKFFVSRFNHTSKNHKFDSKDNITPEISH